MTTPRSRALVSRLSLAAVTLLAPVGVLGACASGAAPRAALSLDEGIVAARALTTIEFENEGRTQVDVYLVNDKRQWRLGRVAPGALTTLRIPEASLTATPGLVWLVALADAPPSAEAVRDPAATLTMAQPVSELVGQRWSYWHPQFGSARLVGARVQAGGVRR